MPKEEKHFYKRDITSVSKDNYNKADEEAYESDDGPHEGEDLTESPSDNDMDAFINDNDDDNDNHAHINEIGSEEDDGEDSDDELRNDDELNEILHQCNKKRQREDDFEQEQEAEQEPENISDNDSNESADKNQKIENILKNRLALDGGEIFSAENKHKSIAVFASKISIDLTVNDISTLHRPNGWLEDSLLDFFSALILVHKKSESICILSAQISNVIHEIGFDPKDWPEATWSSLIMNEKLRNVPKVRDTNQYIAQVSRYININIGF